MILVCVLFTKFKDYKMDQLLLEKQVRVDLGCDLLLGALLNCIGMLIYTIIVLY